MRFLGITDTCDLGSLYLRLANDGHDVKVAIADKRAHGTLAGMIHRVDDYREHLGWIRDAGKDGVILFESVYKGAGTLQDELRAQGFQVIGGSAYGDRLENERGYAQQLLGELGFPAGHVWQFESGAEADAFIAARPGRYVLKLNGHDHTASDTFVGRMDDGRDVRAMLAAKLRSRASASFILMEHIDGIEMGIGAYFDGERFLTPACLDWEHKRFFAGDMGELTGEMGTVVTYDRSDYFFAQTLARIEPYLRGKNHVGYINLNTIVNERGIWPLEFTCRFGYPGYAILDPLQATPWADLFRAMLGDASVRFTTRPGFAVGIVLTTPPFPYSREQVDEPVGLPVLFDGPLDGDDRDNLHYGELGLADGELVTSGLYGWTMVVTGVGASIASAKQAAYARAARVIVPSGRYRLDIGDRLLGGDYQRLEAMRMFS